MYTGVTRLVGVAATYREVISSRRYFPLWLGQLLSNFGDTLHYVALVVLVFQLTGQGLAVAAVVAAEVLPVLLGPVAGVAIDRLSRKAVLVGSDLFRALLVLSLLWPQGSGTPTWWPPGCRGATSSSTRPSRRSSPR